MHCLIKSVSTLAIASLMFSPTISAQDDEEVEEVIVTGSRITQGGAQDIDFFRDQVSLAKIPHPDTLTVEGMLSGYDLIIASDRPCSQTFCLTAEAGPVDLVTMPEAGMLMGLGFNTNIDGKTWQRPPMTLVFTVDKSGSMQGWPLTRVKEAMREAVRHMGAGDQVAVVLYGSTVHTFLPVTEVDGNRQHILATIDQIQSHGSTAMEAGLRAGFSVAQQAAEEFDGITRVMLFTDERPNVGRTDAEGFMGMAKTASLNNVGLTTIGVGGAHYGAELATKISSVRGGNLFYLGGDQDVTDLFSKEFDFLVSEVAHDLKMTITPKKRWKIAGIYGVPGEMLGWQNERTVTFTVPTVFLSSKGGGIFAAMARENDGTNLPEHSDDAPFAAVELSYLDISDGKNYQDRLIVEAGGRADNMSESMQLASLLVDEFTVLTEATKAHHVENDQETAYKLINALASKVRGLDDAPEREETMIFALERRLARLSGHMSEVPAHAENKAEWLHGDWYVKKIKRDYRSKLTRYEDVDFRRGDAIRIDLDSDEFRALRRRQRHDASLHERDQLAYNKDQILLEWAGHVFDYRFKGKYLMLQPEGMEIEILLSPEPVSDLTFAQIEQALYESDRLEH